MTRMHSATVTGAPPIRLARPAPRMMPAMTLAPAAKCQRPSLQAKATPQARIAGSIAWRRISRICAPPMAFGTMMSSAM